MMEVTDFRTRVLRNIRICCHYALFLVAPYYLEVSVFNAFAQGSNQIKETSFVIAQFKNAQAPSYSVRLAEVRYFIRLLLTPQEIPS